MKKFIVLLIMVLGYSYGYSQVTNNQDSIRQVSEALLKKGKAQKKGGFILTGIGVGMIAGAGIAGRTASFDNFAPVILLGVAGGALTITGIVKLISGSNKINKARLMIRSDQLSIIPEQNNRFYTVGVAIRIN